MIFFVFYSRVAAEVTRLTPKIAKQKVEIGKAEMNPGGLSEKK
jgi:hypothetical protein